MSTTQVRGRGRGRARGIIIAKAQEDASVGRLAADLASVHVDQPETPSKQAERNGSASIEERKPFKSNRQLYKSPPLRNGHSAKQDCNKTSERQPFQSERQLINNQLADGEERRSDSLHIHATQAMIDSNFHDDRGSEQYADEHQSSKRLNSTGKNFYRQGNKKNDGTTNSGWGSEKSTASEGSFKFDETQVKREATRPAQKFGKKNTESFAPSHAPAQMRIVAAPSGLRKYNRTYQTRDVLIVHDMFLTDVTDLTIYNKLIEETRKCGVHEEDMWKLWHGDSHLIADDKTRWKQSCPTFNFVIERIKEYFNMDVQATRCNWYRNSNEWKPFHHDAAAMKPEKAAVQNHTVAVSFGAEREVAFEHAETKTVISMPQPNGSVYTFGRDVNVIWRHGVLQVPPEQFHDEGRISIIAWGWMDMKEV